MGCYNGMRVFNNKKSDVNFDRTYEILFSSFPSDAEPEMARVSSLKLGQCYMHEKVVISLSVICSPAAAR